MQGAFVGLTLIHGHQERSTKPRVIVVAEPVVFESLSHDLELDVYPQCFDYDSFIKASLSKSISTHNTIVVVSDALSERMAPLEAVIALVRAHIILIPWKSTEDEIAALGVVAAPRRPTANTLRRVIFTHSGMKELPPRFDGDDFIQEPPDARVVNFAPQSEAAEASNEDATLSSSPLEWFTTPQQSRSEVPREDQPAASEHAWAPDQISEVGEESDDAQISHEEQAITAARAPSVQEDAPSFLPEFFSPQSVNALRGPSTFGTPDAGEKVEETPREPEVNEALAAPRISDHPYTNESSLELDTYINDDSDRDAYVDETPTSFVPDLAISPIDDNGNQQMWSMFDTRIDYNTGASLSEFPDGTDHRKAISLAEPLVVCVYSPKGGVGKTSISVNLAARLAYTTRLQACIVDLDIAFGNVGTRLGLYNPTVRELLNESHIDGESLARNLVYDRRSGLFALLAPLRPETGTNRRKFSPAAYKKILSLLKERFDVIILDCPVELRDPLVSGFALTEAGNVVMVVNNEQATLLDARRALEAMCRSKDSQRLPGLGIDPHSIGLVVNQKVENVGREVEDIRAILGGGDPNHPSKNVDILSVIADDRQLWVGNANMGRTVATSGDNGVDVLLDDIWSKILPDEAAQELQSQDFSSRPLDEIFAHHDEVKSKKKRNFFRRKGEEG